jgi:hypothetical protein
MEAAVSEAFQGLLNPFEASAEANPRAAALSSRSIFHVSPG